MSTILLEVQVHIISLLKISLNKLLKILVGIRSKFKYLNKFVAIQIKRINHIKCDKIQKKLKQNKEINN